MRKRESYRALILENIEYDVLSQNVQLDKDRLDELVELMDRLLQPGDDPCRRGRLPCGGRPVTVPEAERLAHRVCP